MDSLFGKYFQTNFPHFMWKFELKYKKLHIGEIDGQIIYRNKQKSNIFTPKL